MQDNPGKTRQAKAKPTPPQARDARLKAALKANMAKRKAQAKARADNDKEDE